MTDGYLGDSAHARKPAIPGSPADLVARAQDRPIYCTASLGVPRALMGIAVASLRRRFPNAAFVDAGTFYRSFSDWLDRWPRYRDRYGAAIIISRCERLPEGADPFAGPGEHVAGIRVASEARYLTDNGRPVAWHAFVFPASYWFSRFAIDPFDSLSGARYAALIPTSEAEEFRPRVGQSPLIWRVPA